MHNKIWQNVFPDLDLTEYHEEIRNKPVKQMSLREFIVFSREGFLLLYPARFLIPSIIGLAGLAIVSSSLLRLMLTVFTIYFLYKSYDCILMIRDLPKHTTYYDLEIRQDKIFGDELNG